jgi:lipopolysaccharide/colanic/teichoic acid biosynthesis glycosyltransferase
MLTRERRRSDRSGQPFVLLLVDTEGLGPRSSSVLASVFEALAAATRETDVLGWFKQRAVVGLILPELRTSDLAHGCEGLLARVGRALVERLDREAVRKLSIDLHVYPEPRRTGGEGLRPVDPLLYPELRRRLEWGTLDSVVKRGLDVVGSVVLLAALSPLLLLLAALVRLTSPGPVFFRQVRVGKMITPFTMLKFRTMYRGGDHRIHHEFASWFITSSSQLPETRRNGFFKLTDDPRVTPIGRLLRKTSLDELPQLWNVLRGDMSLVGPRPPLPYELEQYKPWHCRRVVGAKPGITGLWQVGGRSRTTFDEMVRLDLRYARTRSFWIDIKILLATPGAVISGKGAC